MIDNIECEGLPHESLKTGEKRKKKKRKSRALAALFNGKLLESHCVILK